MDQKLPTVVIARRPKPKAADRKEMAGAKHLRIVFARKPGKKVGVYRPAR